MEGVVAFDLVWGWPSLYLDCLVWWVVWYVVLGSTAPPESLSEPQLRTYLGVVLDVHLHVPSRSRREPLLVVHDQAVYFPALS